MALWRQMVDDFRSGAIPGEPGLHEGKPNGSWRIRLRRTKIAIPVFDRTFTTAAVVASFTSTTRCRIDTEDARARPPMYDEAGYSRRKWFEGVGYTYVYRKQDGHWNRIHISQDWADH